ncbi:MAG TPA: FAD-dependent monooxygenase [Vicinamibacterales bacterium]|nr:FAD-dependent monooxygenase [Vicinamibacterales bacterium]
MNAKPYDVDVVIVGAGLAGLSLARQLLRADDSVTVLLLDKRAQIPPPGQKVGEATVQVSGYYISKVLDMEEHLFLEHFMKYNLRFIWKTARDSRQIENYSQSYIRRVSNVPSYQLNRNELEKALLQRNEAEPARFTFHNHALDLKIDLDAGMDPHAVSYSRNGTRETVRARWVVDCAGRAHVLQKQLKLEKGNAIRHGASFMWVEGLLNYENLTDMSPKEIRLNPQRGQIGHLPFWLATNHFVEEGLWLWIIPLRNQTSLGLVYDHRVINPDDVNDPTRLVAWICEHFPAFARDLPNRRILHSGSYRDYSFDAMQTIDKHRWAMVGEAGRWSDPLYSPGGDVIAIYNTLVCDAILTTDQAELDAKVPLFEELERAVYAAYLPSFQIGYDCLGDQEAHSLKYVWELTIYFAFYVFPFINDMFTDRRFLVAFLRAFTKLGRVNVGLLTFLRDYFHWKQANVEIQAEPVFFEFFDVHALAVAEQTFYKVGVSVDTARTVLDEQLANVMTLGRYITAHIYAMVLEDPTVVWNKAFVSSLKLESLSFDPARMAADYAVHAESMERYMWPAGWNPEAAFVFKTARRVSPAVAAPGFSPAGLTVEPAGDRL